MIFYTLQGAVPSLKNSKQIFRNKKTGASFITSSKNHKDWHTDAMLQVISQFQHIPETPCHVTITFQFGDNRKVDLSNKAESVLDLLVDAGVLPDDNRFVIPKITLISLGHKKGEWATTITIEQYEENTPV